MINKQSLWFLTLFSLILVLSVYYITMPNELLLTNNSNYYETEKTSGDGSNDDTVVNIEESELLVTMRVNLEDERSKQITELRSTLTQEEATSEEKNNAYEQIKYISNLKAKEESIEKKIKQNFNLECFIKIDGSDVSVIAIKENHDANLANQMMQSIQEEFDNKVYVTIRFEK